MNTSIYFRTPPKNFYTLLVEKEIIMKLNEYIILPSQFERKFHSKASEEYIEVKFIYSNSQVWDGWIPIEYRRTGLSLKGNEEIIEYLNKVYRFMSPDNYSNWLQKQNEFWETKPKAGVTKSFFDNLIKSGWKAKWCCVSCDLPSNPNWARRIQDLKEFGYTLSTNTNKLCKKCQENKTHLLILPLPRIELAGNGYETWTPKFRQRILKVLNNMDAYEGKQGNHLLPDHKFSEIRWDDETKSENLESMSDEEIKNKFQLLSNQRNQQKREICRTCYQTNKRGNVFGIPFYYKGNAIWDNTIPKKGKSAEDGCVGCAWYDIERWRQELIKRIGQN